MSDVTMIARMLRHYSITFDRNPESGLYRLTTFDARLDTTSVYESSAGIGNVIERAYADYSAEYE